MSFLLFIYETVDRVLVATAIVDLAAAAIALATKYRYKQRLFLL